MITIWRQVSEALVLAPLPLAVANVEVDMDWAGYPLVLVRWDLYNKCALKYKSLINYFLFSHKLLVFYFFVELN